jgi:predicted phosphodiesterase
LKTVIAVGDGHAPYHLQSSADLIQSVVEDIKPDYFICLGDLFDFAKISRFSKSRKLHPFDTGQEIAIGTNVIDHMSARAKNKVITLGNHDDRWYQMLRENPELSTVLEMQGLDPLTDGLKELGFEVIPYQQAYFLGRTIFTHEMGFYGKTCVRQTADAAGTTIMFGHAHRLAKLDMSSALGDPITSICAGWWGDQTKIDYKHQVTARREWTQGFVSGVIDNDGLFHFDTNRIHANNSTVAFGNHYKL